ncbi:membrane protein insertase YidC [Campylobacter hepaticus]|uniref:Membrane protein insertase YidC n=1 Tax=Campylobacter hepaticus TaxID=1813019 RepID=A0A6A7JTR2_9BACT|nr:membrane protein insertase YidC [Campylobacter hepaticus]AXP08525.1 membrane protein insertase YidC [Campylobacter hepaticus]MDX2322952.1 membrane protein insertase YidC [Campylobacter hepaticus]MDX2332052.1 membrane protein insertase YidC [Campylobacter hepaticus]MDX2409201.1 membrane protein insertase YidC [Campylobacter hepaticus]MPV54514.1 membrane protein insertase YidC [Campylobacter hepaticus]
MNNSNNIFQQKRILLAVVISFLFFIVYDYFFIPKLPIQTEQNQTQNASKSINAPVQKDIQSPMTTKNMTTKNIIVNIQSQHFQAQIDSLGRIVNFYLKDKKYQDEKGEFINLISSQAPFYPLEIRFSDTSINQEAFNTHYQSDEKDIFIDENASYTIHLKQKLSNLLVEKILTFYPKGNYDIKVKLSKDTHYFITPGYRPDIALDSYTVHGALVMDDKESIHTFEDEKVDKDENIKNAFIASAFDRYYATFFYNFDKPFNVIISKDEKENPLIFVSSLNEFNAGAYIGSKEHIILKSIDPRLQAVVEYGWFTFIAKPMFEFLNFLHQYIGNWGWAIVIMTLIVRIILFPLTYKSMISMNKLKDLAPKMKEIKDRYKGDPQKMNMQMMDLYKKHGANPMSGCLPILLQIPIFFAIYRVLLNAIELKAAPWAFWIHDLSIMDPYFILPILMGATMFLQQLITPMTIQDPMQAKIMKFLPVIFTFFFITFPAGLTLYWFINNLCSLVQQWVINKMFAKEHDKKIDGVKK